MAAPLAILLAAVAAALLPGSPPAAARLERLSITARGRQPLIHRPRAAPLPSVRPRAAAAILAGVAAGWWVGGLAAPLIAAGFGWIAWYGLGRLESGAIARTRTLGAQAVPLVAELLSAAIAAGCPPIAAAEVVADAIGGPVGAALRHAAASARLGSDPGVGWLALGADPDWRPLARALAGAVTRGTSPVGVLDRVAQDARDTARWSAEARARSLGARAAAPLGLCFLPAFVLVAIVPLVVTAAAPVLP
jgi:Flp pilus assembly protein TadB